ncbi:unnamed protein product (macronuclear) [Paramecium tetraurelia]|uniref:Uncharacterized protein n=1 Tax=Paramecium tetraurelia TaxID=5888 RepID=A0BKV4_PARTE|nr:uncharacterized protein GSPATT00029802001 [Paramecium tetraurelia]CAK59171.1 unnamed protein product [Paramecium tetraurelia]|eukprot:XP_001426569.1 hypothetical protein (macronuclear) [Paramecium tetraurelia strain d4-2]
MDGQIIRIDKDINRDEQLNNIEQIKYLLWSRQYNQSHNKVVKWSAIWNGDQLLDVGGYYSVDGLKQGFWKELSRNYSKYRKDQQQIKVKIKFMNVENTEMDQEFRNGSIYMKIKQCIIFYDKCRGGGSYNQIGRKKGKWVDLTYDFWKYCNQLKLKISQSQVTYCGEYLDGERIGLWDIFYKKKELRFIGGGSYVWKKERGDLNSKKVGIWTELAEGFQDNNQTIWCGEYKNNQKVGKWVILKRKDQFDPFQHIGGGSYDHKSEDRCVIDSIKIGYWVEFRNGEYDCQVTQSGQYIKGKKFGRWESFLQGEQIGGGSYDPNPENEENPQDPIKFGKWIELSEGFQIQ